MKRNLCSGLCGSALLLAGFLLVGCSRTPMATGAADVSALGYGIGRELSGLLNSGGTVVVVTTPGAVGYVKEIESACVAGLDAILSEQGFTVSETDFTDSEVESYQRVQPSNLDEAVYAAPLERASGNPVAVVSLVGWPSPAKQFSGTPVVVVVEWVAGSGGRTLPGVDTVVTIRPVSGTPEGNPPTRLDTDGALAWFDQRFVVEVSP